MSGREKIFARIREALRIEAHSHHGTGLPTTAAFQHIGILSLEFHVDKLSRPLL